jgi:hypothetical protein
MKRSMGIKTRKMIKVQVRMEAKGVESRLLLKKA